MNKHILIAFVFAALSHSVSHAQTTKQVPKRTAVQVVDRALEAHGGLEAWRRVKHITYTLNLKKPSKAPAKILLSFPTSGSFDLRGRLGGQLMAYREGSTTVWDAKGRKVDDPRRHADAAYSLPTLNYIWSLPWKLKDPGTRLKRIKDRVVAGKTLRGVLVTFDAGTGEYPEDWYRYYFDAKTGRLHSVLFEEHHPRNQAIIWLTFEGEYRANGLVFPRRWVYHRGSASGERGPLLKEVELVELGTQPLALPGAHPGKSKARQTPPAPARPPKTDAGRPGPVLETP